VRFGPAGCAELLVVDDGVGQEGPDQMKSFILGNGSNQNRAPGDTSRYVYSNKGLGRQAVMIRRCVAVSAARCSGRFSIGVCVCVQQCFSSAGVAVACCMPPSPAVSVKEAFCVSSGPTQRP
jgi:hypothetical protein